MRALITGGAGFIGSSLAIRLINEGYEVRVLDNLNPQIHGPDPEQSRLYLKIKDKVEFYKGDVRDLEIWKQVLPNVDVIFHLAAETGTGQSMYEISKYTDVNIGGTAGLLETLGTGAYPAQQIIVSSSRAVYGEGKYYCTDHGVVFPISRKIQDLSRRDFECKCPICNDPVQPLATDEDSKINPVSFYGLTKYTQEQMILSMASSLGINACALRYQNVYGPGQSLNNPYTGILSIFSNRARQGTDILIFEDGKETRDFVYIDDVVDATFLPTQSNLGDNKIINVGTGTEMTVLEIAKSIIKFFDSKGSKAVINYKFRLGDIRHNKADTRQLSNLTNFKRKTDFKTGLGNFLKWVEEQSPQRDQLDQSLKRLQRQGLYR